MMHAIKGGWVGQTFALAKYNESEGKKIRIRRSKEERKTMVESFIKKYQSSNNGNFPSLNLTHKEVGGSFYTVREIVREIIQENRVLGPAKLFAEEMNTNQFNEEYPLGTISTELQTPPDMTSNGSHFVPSHQKGDNEEHPLDIISTELQTPPDVTSIGSPLPSHQKDDNEHPFDTISTELQTPFDMTSNGSPFVPSHQKGNNEDQVSISGGPCRENENQMFDNEQIINGSQVDANNEESDCKSTYEELQTIKSFETDQGIENLATPTAKVSPITKDVVVETFPLRPVPKTADYSSTTYGVKNSTETLEKNVIEKVILEAGNDSVPLVQIHSSKNSGSVGGQNVSILADVAMDKNSDMVNSEVVEKIADPESSDCSTKGGTVPDTAIGRSIEVEVSHSNVLTPEITEENQGIDRTKGYNEINAPKGKILNDTYGSSGRQESKTPKANVIVNEGGIPSKETSKKGSNPTVDRINLESWERASRNSSEMETNPLVVIFKSFVTAFVKFWSE